MVEEWLWGCVGYVLATAASIRTQVISMPQGIWGGCTCRGVHSPSDILDVLSGYFTSITRVLCVFSEICEMPSTRVPTVPAGRGRGLKGYFDFLGTCITVFIPSW